MIALAIAVGAVVVYSAVGGVVYGYIHQRRTDQNKWDADEAAVPSAIFWPITAVVFGLYKIRHILSAPATLGRRLAKPRAQLPEARVVSEGGRGAGTAPLKGPGR